MGRHLPGSPARAPAGSIGAQPARASTIESSRKLR
jgi:hypothetical protein